MRLRAEEIGYVDRSDKNQKLKDAFALCREEHTRLGYEALAVKISLWWKDHCPEQEVENLLSISKSTLYDLNASKKIPGWGRARILYAFFSAGPTEFRYIGTRGLGGVLKSEQGIFFEMLLGYFSAGSVKPYQGLKDLIGTYECYRPSWRPGSFDEIIISILEVKERDGGYWLIEKQEFYSEREDTVIKQTDLGPLMYFGGVIACLSRSEKGDCMKLYSIHECNGDTGTGESIEWGKGQVMAISNRGPHFTSPIFFKRTAVPGKSESVKLVELEQDSRPGFDAVIEYLREGQSPDKLLPPKPSS